MSKLLIDDYPIQVLPTLAKEIGLNEAIVLQQMHYWLNMSKHSYDDKKWIYNSYTKWVLQFPFWSESTVKRAIGSLEKQNLLHIGNYNKAGFDKTKWYSINYEELNKRVTRPSGQNDPTIGSKWTDDEFNLNRPIPEITTEITTETTNNNSATDVTQEQFEEWWNLYNKKKDKKKANSLFKSTLKKYDYETIMKGTEEYLKTIKDKQYQKYPKTFLSQESFLNDYGDEVKTSEESYLDKLMEEG